MGRLISPPVGLGVVSIEPLAGPRTVGAAGTQTLNGYVQTVASPFSLWRYQIAFHAMRESEFREYRGWISEMHGGANATRWHMFDPDMIRPKEAGIDVSSKVRWDNLDGVLWDNGQPWSNGQEWASSAPKVAVAATATRGDTQISLANSAWGHTLKRGSDIGFVGIFCKHRITSVLAPGTYLISPPLRRNLTTSDRATLFPTLAMRLESEEAANAGRGLVVAEGLAVTLVEVPHYTVIDRFSD